MPLKISTVIPFLLFVLTLSGCNTAHHATETKVRDDMFLYISAGHWNNKKEIAFNVAKVATIETKVTELTDISDTLLTGSMKPDAYCCDIEFKEDVFIDGKYLKTVTDKSRIQLAPESIPESELAIIKQSAKRSFEAEQIRLKTSRKTGA